MVTTNFITSQSLTKSKDHYHTGWTAVQRGVMINYDLENSPLQIKTNSVEGSDEETWVYFYSAQGDNGGRVYLYFTSPPQFYLDWCSASRTNFPSTLPSEVEKVWTITFKTISDVPALVLHCNDEEVLNVVISDATCGQNIWKTYWSRDVEKMQFDSRDKASDYYRPGKTSDFNKDA